MPNFMKYQYLILFRISSNTEWHSNKFNVIEIEFLMYASIYVNACDAHTYR